MHPLVSKYFLYLPLQYLRGEKVLSHLKELKKTQWFSTKELSQWQWEKLTALLKYAYTNVPYYKDILNQLEINPYHSLTYEDFIKLPIMDKQRFRLCLPKLKSQNCPHLDIRRTSGSTGVPLEIPKDRNTIARIRAIMYRYYSWYDIDIGDKQARVLGHPVTFLSRLKEDIQDIILNKTRLDPVFLTPKNMINYYRKLKKIKPKYMYGYPSAIYEFARYLISKSIDPSDIRLKVIITTGEVLYPFQREFIQSVYKAKVVNEYGCTECGIIAFECPYGNLHLSSDNLFIEILKDDQPAKPGEWGEVVVTELFNYSVPMIRYKVGDLMKVSQKQCKCGRGLPIVESVEGRTSEFIELPEGRKVHTELFHYISDAVSEQGGGIKHFRVIQKEIDKFICQIVPDDNFSDKTLNILNKKFKEFLGNNINLKIQIVNEIPKDKSGKLRYFVSEISSEKS